MWKSSEGYTPLWNKILLNDHGVYVLCRWWQACTYVLAAYLKNSVTRFVEPLSVIAWRVGAWDVAMSSPRRKERAGCRTSSAPFVRVVGREGDHVKVFNFKGVVKQLITDQAQ